MAAAIVFGCFVYTSNNTVAAAALENWPDRVMAGEWVLLIAAEELLGTFGKVLIGLGVSCAVLSGIMGFYLASSRLMYSMSRDGYLPPWFGKVDSRYGTPGASIGYFFTCASTMVTMKRDGDGTQFLKVMAILGVVFSVAFMILQLIPIPGLSGVHFGRESYMMLVAWIAIGLVFYVKERKHFGKAE